MTHEEINRVEELLKMKMPKLRKLANDTHKECNRRELVVMILENELEEQPTS
jgi:hypothetical protein